MLKRASKSWINPKADVAAKAVEKQATRATPSITSEGKAPPSASSKAPPVGPKATLSAAPAAAPTRPAGLPERPSLSRQASTAASRAASVNGSAVRETPASETRGAASLPAKPVTSEASEREAQARAAVQASQASRAAAAAARVHPATTEQKAATPRVDDSKADTTPAVPLGPRADRLGRTPTPMAADTRSPARFEGARRPYWSKSGSRTSRRFQPRGRSSRFDGPTSQSSLRPSRSAGRTRRQADSRRTSRRP